jgi:hypothetical protein
MIVAPLTALILGGTVVGSAEEPAAPAATPAAATTPASTPAPPVTNTEHAQSPAPGTSPSAVPAAAAPADSATALAAARDKRLRNLGYKPEVRKGETIYCRSEALVGTRFPTKVCGTADQLDQITTDDKDATLRLQRAGVNPLDK